MNKIRQFEAFKQYTEEDFDYEFKIKSSDILFAVGNSLNEADAFFIGKKDGMFWCSYTNDYYNGLGKISSDCTPENLREYVNKKISQKKKTIVYWWRDEILKFIDELEKNESVQTA